MADIYKCRNCGAVTTEKEHLCAPEAVEGKSDYCGTRSAGQVCEPMRQDLAYACDTCGRPAERPELLCKPAKISV